MKNKNILKFGFLLLFIALAVVIEAQCPMCRMSAETNLQNGGTEGKGLNMGILYMLSFPYILVSIIGFLWYRNRKKELEEQANSASS